MAELLGVCMNATFVLLGHLPPVARVLRRQKKQRERETSDREII